MGGGHILLINSCEGEERMIWKFLTPEGFIPCEPMNEETKRELNFRQHGEYGVSNSRNGGTWFFKITKEKD